MSTGKQKLYSRVWFQDVNTLVCWGSEVFSVCLDGFFGCCVCSSRSLLISRRRTQSTPCNKVNFVSKQNREVEKRKSKQRALARLVVKKEKKRKLCPGKARA